MEAWLLFCWFSRKIRANQLLSQRRQPTNRFSAQMGHKGVTATLKKLPLLLRELTDISPSI